MRHVAPVIVVGGPHPHTGETRAKPIIAAFTPADCAPGYFWQAERKRLDRDRLMRAVAAQPGWPTAMSYPRLRRQRLAIWRPHGRGRRDADHITQAKLANPRAQPGVVTVSPVRQHHAPRNTGCICGLHLSEGNCRFGFERYCLGHAGLLPPRLVLGPLLRQVQTIADRQAGVMIGDRQRHRYLAIARLAKLAAILMRHPDRVPSLLGKACVIDDPRLDRSVSLDPRQYLFAYLGEHPFVRPRRLANEMQQRLMLRCHP